MTMEELKPCPYCGGKAEYDNCDNGTGQWIECDDCGAMLKVPYSTSYERLFSMWNRRVVEPHEGFAI
jgi:Lar family restriction alleviation protein